MAAGRIRGQPWGPLQRPASPLEAERLSDKDLERHLQLSKLRTGCLFDPRSFNFDKVNDLPEADMQIRLRSDGSMPGAVKYIVNNIESTNQALIGLLEQVPWSGAHISKLGKSQEDGKRRILSFDALLLYFEHRQDPAALALCQEVIFRLKTVVTWLLAAFHLPPVPHKLGVLLTEWGASDQEWHDDSLGVSDTYSGLLAVMKREIDLAREDGNVHTLSMAAGEGCIFESWLVHRGKGAPEPTRRARNEELPGFTMMDTVVQDARRVRIQSAGIHFYGGRNASKIPLSDKYAQLNHHQLSGIVSGS